MAVVTQRDLVESITGLRDVARDLLIVAVEPSPEGAPHGTVLVNARTLDVHARYLQSVADEIALLITDKKVVVPS